MQEESRSQEPVSELSEASIPAWVRMLDIVALLAIAGSALAITIGSLGEYIHWLELLSHFRLQYVGIALATGVYYIARSKYRNAIVCFLLLLTVVPDLASRFFVSLPEGSSPMRLAAANVSISNVDSANLTGWVNDSKPDAICLLEVDNTWLDRLRPMQRDRFPHHVSIPRRDRFGIAFFAREDFEYEVFTLTQFALPALRIRMNAPKPVEIWCVHPPPPIGRSTLARNRAMDEIAAAIKDAEGDVPIVLIGDLNNTIWSPSQRNFMEETGLASQSWSGYLPTWPANLMIRIPIDQCLVSEEIFVSDVSRGPDFGSDHLPLYCDIHY